MALHGGTGADASIPVSSGGTYRPGPRGHALFVRRFDQPFGSRSVGAFVERYVELGFTWIALELPASRSTLEEFGRELAAAEIPIAAFWNLPGATWRTELPTQLQRAETVGARFLLPNPERFWLGKDREARAFAAELARPALPIVLSTYGTPQGFPTFPWAAFASVTSTGMPLLFDRDLHFDPAYFARGIEGWRSHGFETIDPAGSCWSHADDRMKSTAEIARHLVQLPSGPANALWAPSRLSDDAQAVLRAWNEGRTAELEEVGRGARARPARSGSRARSGGAGGGAVALGALVALGLVIRSRG